MPTLIANDGVTLHYETYGSPSAAPLILLHGFTGSGAVFKRNVSALSNSHHVIVPDLRGHGESDKPKAGYHVARLAMDLKNLIDEFSLRDGTIKAIGVSLGAAILWSYSELFSTRAFSRMIFVDQSPLQNYADDWGPEFGSRGLNSEAALRAVQKSLIETQKETHIAIINECLGYRSHPQPGDPTPDSSEWKDDEAFFMAEGLKGDGWWLGKLMADHTAIDWRHSISQSFGPGSGSKTQVLVVASSRSGSFPAAGPLKVVELVNGEEKSGLAKGTTIDWGGHWCYWEKPDRFNELVSEFLA